MNRPRVHAILRSVSIPVILLSVLLSQAAHARPYGQDGAAALFNGYDTGTAGDSVADAVVASTAWHKVTSGIAGNDGDVVDLGGGNYAVNLGGGAGMSMLNPVKIWTNPAGGSWNTAVNWAGNSIANGASDTADFATLTLPNDAIVTLDGARTIGGMRFGDAGNTRDWMLATGSGGPLTLDAGGNVPAIEVINRKATIAAVLAGSHGLVKTGSGTLTLTGANSYTGDTTVEAGTLRVAHPTLAANSTVLVASGAWLQLDFAGTNPVASLFVGGVSKAAGVYDAANLPGYLAGPGKIQVTAGPVAVVFDVPGLSVADTYLVQTLQGLVNRSGPRLMFGASNTYADSYVQDSTWNAEWRAVYEQEQGLRFRRITGLTNLLQFFRNDFTGLVVYDPTIDGTRCVAMTLAGVHNLLPVTDPAPYAWLGLPVLRDLRGQFATSVAAYQWALTNVMPLCNRKFAHTPGGGGANVDGLYLGWGFEGFDYTVMNKGFIFNLTFEYNDVTSWGRNIDGDPTQANLYRAILDALDKPAFICGYGEWENDWFNLLGQKGHQYLHWGDNYSFHAKVPITKPLQQQVAFTPANVTVQADKYYVCFVTTEGDTMKGPMTSFFHSWNDPARGSVAMNWAVHPAMSRFPAMLAHYYATATPKDYFAAMQAYTLEMADAAGFAQTVKTEFDASGLRVISGSYAGTGTLAANKRTFFDTIQPLGGMDLVFDNGVPREGYQEFYPNGMPLAGTPDKLVYWQRLLPGGWDADWKALYRGTPAEKQQVLDALIGEINYVASKQQPPFVIVINTDLHNCNFLPTFHADVAARLAPQFKVARLDEALAAVRQWKATTAPVVDSFEIGFDNWTTDWDRVTDQKHTGSYAARANPDDNPLTSNSSNTSAAVSMKISFWYRDAGIDDNDNAFLQLWNGSSWVNRFELGNSAENTWNYYETTLSNAGGDAVFFRPDFKLRFDAAGLDWGFLGLGDEYLWIDDVRVTVQQPTYATWAAANGAAADPAADSNHNGVADGIEFFMGGTVANPATLPPLVTAAGSVTWTLPYVPSAAATWRFQVSDDLTGWTDVPPGDEKTSILIAPDRIRLTLPAATTKKFCRLAVTPTL